MAILRPEILASPQREPLEVIFLVDCSGSIEGLLADRDAPVIWRGPMKHKAIRQFLGEVEWGRLDFSIIDSPPGTGDEPMSVAQVVSDAQAIMSRKRIYITFS